MSNVTGEITAEWGRGDICEIVPVSFSADPVIKILIWPSKRKPQLYISQIQCSRFLVTGFYEWLGMGY